MGEKELQTYEGNVKVRFPFDNMVQKGRLQGLSKEGQAILTLKNGEVHSFNMAQLVRYFVRGHIWRDVE